jgi:hypothetical protein
MISIRHLPLVALLAFAACDTRGAMPAAARVEYLYLWTASADSTQPDFLAVLDVTADSAGYGRLVTTLTVPGTGHGPHHTEHELAADGRLLAKGGQSRACHLYPAATRDFRATIRDTAANALGGRPGSLDRRS